MAIETMDVGDLDVNELHEAIRDFVNRYHPELFSSILKNSGTSTTTMYIDADGTEKSAVEVLLSRSTTSSPFRLGHTYTDGIYNASGTSSGGVKKLYSTDNGIMFTWKPSNVERYLNSPRRASFIASLEPGYGLVAHGMSMYVTSSGTGQSVTHVINGSTEAIIDFYNPRRPTKDYCSDIITGSASLHILPEYCRPATKTMMIPMVLSSGYVCQNIFRQVYSENPGTEGVFTLGGTRFVTNGYFALKD